MAINVITRIAGQGMYRALTTFLDGVAGSGESEAFPTAEYIINVFHVIRNGAATGSVLVQSSMDGTNWVTLTTINVANGNAEYAQDQRCYPFMRVTYTTIAGGTVSVRGSHAGGI